MSKCGLECALMVYHNCLHGLELTKDWYRQVQNLSKLCCEVHVDVDAIDTEAAV